MGRTGGLAKTILHKHASQEKLAAANQQDTLALMSEFAADTVPRDDNLVSSDDDMLVDDSGTEDEKTGATTATGVPPPLRIGGPKGSIHTKCLLSLARPVHSRACHHWELDILGILKIFKHTFSFVVSLIVDFQMRHNDILQKHP